MNISSSSSEARPNVQRKRTDDKYFKYKKKIKLKDFIGITNNFIQNYKTYILSLKELLKKNISNINLDINSNKLNENIDYITKKIEILFSKYINEIKNSYNSKYENILKLYEQKIRFLYENKFNLELNRRILEESNRNLLRKEKEYELIKEKTGIVVVNNKIINNDRKENEIFILRKENSILKDTIEKQKKEIEKLKKNIKQSKSSSKPKKISKEKSYIISPRLIIKSHNISKIKSRHKAQSLSLGQVHYRKIHYSHPKSLYYNKFDFLTSLSNSLSRSKNNFILNSRSYKNYFSDFAKKLFNTSTKKKSKSKPFLNNILNNINNIKLVKVRDIKKTSPLKLLKKGKIPNNRQKNILSFNKKEKKICDLKRKGNNSTLCIKKIKRELNNVNNNNFTSHSKKKNYSECTTDKNNNINNSILLPGVMKTINTEKNKQKTVVNNKRSLSPSYGNLKYLKNSNVNNKFNSGLKEIKNSKSFNKNYAENNFSKKKGKDKNNKKIINLVFKRGVKNFSHNVRNNNNNSNKRIKLMNSKNKSNAIMNNIKTINNTSNNSKIKLKIPKK